MKKRRRVILLAALALSLAACGNGAETETTQAAAETETTQAAGEMSAEASEAVSEAAEEEAAPESAQAESADGDGESGEESRVLIAYFSVPEDVEVDGTDANSGASVVVKDGEVLGNVQYMAQIIQESTGGDLFRIETVQQYPLDHDPLVDQAAAEQDENARPELTAQVEDPSQYDVVFLGYPNWWGDMPMALYTFLEENDFSGKTIIPFCPHGGSRFSRTEQTIAELQPGAEVSENGLTISRNDVAGCEEEVKAWVESLGL